MTNCDFLIIGAGMAGSSAAYELAKLGSVVVIEREDTPGYHTTGRSAAVFLNAYGNETVRGITNTSRAFFDSPPQGFTDVPLLAPLGALFVGREDQISDVERHYQDCHHLVPDMRLIDSVETCKLVPSLRPDYIAGAVFEPSAMSIDVNALHQGYLRGLKNLGGKLLTESELIALDRKKNVWEARTKSDIFSAPIIINAAGAWCDAVGNIAGARPIGLIPKRRTAFIFDPPPNIEIGNWPLIADINEEFYIKPDAGRLLGSPADETPVPPQDIQPEELDIAIAVERIQTATNLKISKIINKWAGLRSFVEDKTLVAGFDPEVEGFFWLAGQGGYGIQTAPAMASITAALATGRGLPHSLCKRGVKLEDLDPIRLR